ncbi:bifunctional homocysteine S-methyltransferase/methylenetetrahydrofolate reductase [Cohnella sp. JJ-181]|uniref:bifunctional homocysteine S-methyltransferase/methylenetetrahydrofolate reductase n=1 Tax=Cohnella rhizoplanae TaxID=2974897 RepID=UPI0022FF5842|nr:bifunctional homocysteine S-methyltransferase/methylenetetrahydrofolate reductase [Cohnella sp. JJ-181]CAI6023313.1 Bifunctional homocysteine S-methyltransferase/5,10-methylenetetrahydrofolate reductase [Cohnella sp. JJ-181]
MKPDLRTALSQRPLVGDGAMGTYLYQLGFPIGVAFEEYNLIKPEIIVEVHRRYAEAGAEVLETNTFAAQYGNLARFGLEKRTAEINAAGVALARQAGGEAAYVLGAVGAIRAGQRKNARTAEITRDYEEQIGALVGAGADGILLETFFELDELMLALRIARRLGDLPVLCQFAVDDPAFTRDGVPMGEALRRLKNEGADVVGFNCRSGPNGILRAVQNIPLDLGLPLSAFPNAGLPDYEDGKVVYSATPAYFGENARTFADNGVRLIGGCCGTTPEHVRAIAEALQGYVPSATSSLRPATAAEAPAVPARQATDTASEDGDQEPANIVELVRKRHTVIVELDPPKDLDIGRFMAGAAALRDAGADALTLADNSLAVTRMSNMALGALVQERVGIRPLVHIACRDRNLIGTQSHMMGFDALGIDHVLAVTGDPAKFGDLPGSSSVYDLTSFEIIKMIKQLNEGVAFSGRALKQKAKFVIGAAFNPNVKHLDKAVQRLEKKVAAGADYIMTQPVYDAELIERIAESTKHLNVPIFIGIFPLKNGRNAEYMHNEVPGIQLSDAVRERMRGLEGPEGWAEGIAIAKELLDTAMKHFNGIYLMTPFLNYEMTAELTRYVREKSGAHADNCGCASCPTSDYQVK